MKYIDIAGTGVKASNIVMGCMRLASLSKGEAEVLIRTAMDEGVNFFDHADIYGGGECETLFAQACGMAPSLREKMIIQSKCGIRNGYFDFSKEHIISSVDGILGRLNTEYLDFLLLHRPDSLMEPGEVAEAFQTLEKAGKVRHFGVSNQNPMQIELLQSAVTQRLAVNQLQFSMVHTPMIDSGIAANMQNSQATDRTGHILEYSQLKKMTIQAWSPFQQGTFGGPFLGDREKYGELNDTIDRIAEQYGVTNTAIAVAWITRHPANIQVILGTTNAQRMRDGCSGSELSLTRQEWYELYAAAGNIIP